MEPMAPRQAAADESVAAFFRRRFGPATVDLVAAPLLGGIHAGDVERLSMRSLFPRFAGEAACGSVLRTPAPANRRRRRARSVLAPEWALVAGHRAQAAAGATAIARGDAAGHAEGVAGAAAAAARRARSFCRAGICRRRLMAEIARRRRARRPVRTSRPPVALAWPRTAARIRLKEALSCAPAQPLASRVPGFRRVSGRAPRVLAAARLIGGAPIGAVELVTRARACGGDIAASSAHRAPLFSASTLANAGPQHNVGKSPGPATRPHSPATPACSSRPRFRSVGFPLYCRRPPFVAGV